MDGTHDNSDFFDADALLLGPILAFRVRRFFVGLPLPFLPGAGAAGLARKEINMETELLMRLGKRASEIDHLWEFDGNAEAEVLVRQTVIAASKRLESGGLPFSFRGNGATRPRQMCGTDNAGAYARLLHDGMFREDVMPAVDVDPPGDVTVDSNGNVPVIFPTNKLLCKLASYFEGQAGSENAEAVSTAAEET